MSQAIKPEHFLCIGNELDIVQTTPVDPEADLSNEKVEQILVDFVNEMELDHKDFIIISSDFLKNFDRFEESYLSEMLRVSVDILI
jgi:hypothetical protein